MRTESPDTRRLNEAYPGSILKSSFGFGSKEGDGTGGGLIALLAGLFEQERGNRTVNDLQYRREQFWMDFDETAQGNRERQHPLAHRHLGDDMIDQMGGGICATLEYRNFKRPFSRNAFFRQGALLLVLVTQVQCHPRI